MQIRINGEKRAFPSPLTLAQLLQTLHFDSKTVVVEQNFQIIPKDKTEKTPVNEGDTIEIVRIVGGG
jgi:sulfur carrier protein